MKAGWRVRRARARRRERLLQDFTGFPVQVGPAAGPRPGGAETRGNAGPVQVVRDVQSPQPPQQKCRQQREIPPQALACGCDHTVSLHGPLN